MCSNIIDLRYFVLNFLSKPVIGLLFKEIACSRDLELVIDVLRALLG